MQPTNTNSHLESWFRNGNIATRLREGEASKLSSLERSALFRFLEDDPTLHEAINIRNWRVLEPLFKAGFSFEGREHLLENYASVLFIKELFEQGWLPSSPQTARLFLLCCRRSSYDREGEWLNLAKNEFLKHPSALSGLSSSLKGVFFHYFVKEHPDYLFLLEIARACLRENPSLLQEWAETLSAFKGIKWPFNQCIEAGYTFGLYSRENAEELLLNPSFSHYSLQSQEWSRLVLLITRSTTLLRKAYWLNQLEIVRIPLEAGTSPEWKNCLFHLRECEKQELQVIWDVPVLWSAESLIRAINLGVNPNLVNKATGKTLLFNRAISSIPLKSSCWGKFDFTVRNKEGYNALEYFLLFEPRAEAKLIHLLFSKGMRITLNFPKGPLLHRATSNPDYQLLLALILQTPSMALSLIEKNPPDLLETLFKIAASVPELFCLCHIFFFVTAGDLLHMSLDEALAPVAQDDPEFSLLIKGGISLQDAYLILGLKHPYTARWIAKRYPKTLSFKKAEFFKILQNKKLPISAVLLVRLCRHPSEVYQRSYQHSLVARSVMLEEKELLGHMTQVWEDFIPVEAYSRIPGAPLASLFLSTFLRKKKIPTFIFKAYPGSLHKLIAYLYYSPETAKTVLQLYFHEKNSGCGARFLKTVWKQTCAHLSSLLLEEKISLLQPLSQRFYIVDTLKFPPGEQFLQKRLKVIKSGASCDAYYYNEQGDKENLHMMDRLANEHFVRQKEFISHIPQPLGVFLPITIPLSLTAHSREILCFRSHPDFFIPLSEVTPEEEFERGRQATLQDGAKMIRNGYYPLISRFSENESSLGETPSWVPLPHLEFSLNPDPYSSRYTIVSHAPSEIFSRLDPSFFRKTGAGILPPGKITERKRTTSLSQMNYLAGLLWNNLYLLSQRKDYTVPNLEKKLLQSYAIVASTYAEEPFEAVEHFARECGLDWRLMAEEILDKNSSEEFEKSLNLLIVFLYVVDEKQ